MRRHLIHGLAALAVAATLVPTSPAAATGTWLWPISPPHVTRPFQPPPRKWLPGHRGVDLAGTAGTAVSASGAGRVVFAGDLAGKGVVVVSHGALRTTYEPVSATVHVGQHVTAGQQIGVLAPGESHCSTWGVVSCLHWGLRRGRIYLDPLGLVHRKPRLLPQGR